MRFDAEARRVIFAVLSLLNLKLVIPFAFALKSRFVMDEFVPIRLGAISRGRFVRHDLASKAVGYDLFYKLAHWLGQDAQSMLLSGHPDDRRTPRAVLRGRGLLPKSRDFHFIIGNLRRRFASQRNIKCGEEMGSSPND
jgi:hypothetical protein